MTDARSAVVDILYRQMKVTLPNMPGARAEDKGKSLGEWADEILAAVQAAQTPQEGYEYGVRTLLNTAQFSRLDEAEQLMRVLDGVNPNARLVRRVKAGPWEEFE